MGKDRSKRVNKNHINSINISGNKVRNAEKNNRKKQNELKKNNNTNKINKKNKKSRYAKQKKGDIKTAYIFLIPWILGFTIFTGIPFLYTFFLSFNDVSLDVRGWNIKWTGISNYVTATLKNIEFTPALMTFISMILVYVPAIIVVSLILALLLNSKVKGRTIFRIIYFLPVIVLSGSAMMQLMDSGGTMIGDLEDYVVVEFMQGIFPGIGDVIESLINNFTIVLWFTGVPIVLIINGLQKINPEQYEAVAIDGASAWQTLWKITMPQIGEVILVSTIFSIVQISSYSINPVNGIITAAIYNTAAGLGLASAYASIYSLITLLIIGIAFLILHKKEKTPKYQKRLIRK